MFENAKLPKTAAGWVALAIFVALATGAAWQASNGNWIATIIAALGTLGTAINKGIWPKATGAAIFIGVLLLGGAGCKLGPYDIAVRSVRTMQEARDLTGAQLGAAIRSQRAQCIEQHGSKTQGYADCMRSIFAGQDKWKKIARPVVDTTCQVATTALKTTAFVEKCKKEKNCDKKVLALLALGYCAISRGLRFFGHFFSDKGSAVLNTLGAFEGVTCGK